MKTFNYYIQTGSGISIILILLAAVLENGMLFYLFYLQIGIGIYQFLVGSYFAYINALEGRFKKYVYFALVDLITLAVFAIIDPEDFRLIITFVAFVVPWMLAVYCYILSYQYYKQS